MSLFGRTFVVYSSIAAGVCLVPFTVDCGRAAPAPTAPSTLVEASASSASTPVVTSASVAVAPPTRLPSTTLDATERALHVYERLAFGPRPGDVERIAALGPAAPAAIEAWIGAQLDPARIDDHLLDAKLAGLPVLAMTTAELLDAYPRPGKNKKKADEAGDEKSALKRRDKEEDADAERERVPPEKRPIEVTREMSIAKVVRAVESERQLQEVLVDFWFNHFNVDSGKGADRWLIVGYERDAIRPHIFGKFRDLLGATAHDPAMLFYLDNWLSARDGFGDERPGGGKKGGKGGDERTKKKRRSLGLNENYGRELLELHTLGVDGGYTQADVREVARVFTGWTIEKPLLEGTFLFRPRMHDEGTKTILGETFDPSAGTASGEAEGEHLLDVLAKSPKTAHFLARKLCQRFVADDPPAALVDRVAARYLETDGDLRAVYEAIFFSPELWDRSIAFRRKVKDPFELVASALRAVGAHVGVEATNGRKPDRYGQGIFDQLGEPLYRCAPPTGYRETADAWVNAGALLARIQVGLSIAHKKAPSVRFELDAIGGPAVAKLDDPGALVDALSAAIVHAPLSPTTHDTIVRELGKRGADDDVWGDSAHEAAVAKTLGLLLGSPEFQRQ